MVLTFDSGDVLEHPQLNNMIRALSGDGVVSGFAVTQNSGVADMSVDVALGVAMIGGIEESQAGVTDLTIEAAHATEERKDLITYDADANSPAVVKGTDHAGTDVDPTYPPDIPAGDILLAIVKVDAATTTIVNGDITDGRIIIATPKLFAAVASDTLRDSDDSIEDIPTTGYTKIKEIGPVPKGIVGGTLRIKFAMNETGIGNSYGMIVKNASTQVGTERTITVDAYTTFSEDLDNWEEGDTIELWVKHSVGTGNGNVKEFRVYCDHQETIQVPAISW